MQSPSPWAPLTRELDNPRSPIRTFLDDRLNTGLRAVQTRYRNDAPTALLVPPGTANAGTVGTAADWLLRFVVYPAPDIRLALRGGKIAADLAGLNALPAMAQIAKALTVPPPSPHAEVRTFTGPVPGSTAEPDMLVRACWALALFTEVYRFGPMAVQTGPLSRFQGREPGRDELLALAPDDALDQLAGIRRVFEDVLATELAKRPGAWALGPTFSGSKLMKGDADLIAAGLLLEVKTTKAKPALSKIELYQLLGYALMDLDDAFGLDSVAIFNARYGYLATWDLVDLLQSLAGSPASLTVLRDQFKTLLIAGPAGPEV